MVEKIVLGEKVLVPVVYLSAASADKYRLDGATIAANDVSLDATGTVTNTGTLKAGNSLSIDARDLVNGGQMKAGGVLYANASNDILNRNGVINARQVTLSAGRDVLSDTRIALGQSDGASIEAGDALSIRAGRGIALAGTQITAKGQASLAAGRDITLSSSQYQGLPAGASAPTLATRIAAGQNAVLNARRDITLDRSTVTAGNSAVLAAGRDFVGGGHGAVGRADGGQCRPGRGVMGSQVVGTRDVAIAANGTLSINARRDHEENFELLQFHQDDGHRVEV
ncbi:hypothetical protein EBB59_09370 [Lysobacter pythonis]|uniref:Filamentous hemagglutinin n=1 Tax=Solilutibacter pythonis TaxID=2483112 RepID=A0A3M2HM87_9GAMM|nr:hemagglutinin repeat-containing protein [Lysobacter pythonis]RMH90826.1 hypothetical protein EBB59_09370 [Lysobacter pythonis]